MKELKFNHGIIGTEIFGFDTVSCNSLVHDESVFDHPGFKIITDAANKDITKLESWMREGDITNNPKGLLWQHIKDTDPVQMTRTHLIQQVKELRPIAKEHEELKETHAVLLAKLNETEQAYLMERKLNEEFMAKLTAKIEECGQLQKELIRLSPA